MTNRQTAYNTVASLVDRFHEQIESYKKAAYNETLARRDFIDPFFKALGWDIDNTQGYAEAYREVIHEDKIKVGAATKAPDYSFRLPGGKRLFFVEAKKPSVAVKTDILPAYQVRRYAWSAKLPVSILTDFEEFAVYDCNQKPLPTDKASAGRIKYLTYTDYLKEFDFLWDAFSKEKVLKGSFDKFIAGESGKRGTASVDKEFLLSLNEWRVQLAENIALRNPQLTEDELNYAVQQTLDRLIFLRIAEDRGVEEYARLQGAASSPSAGGGRGEVYPALFQLFKEADEKYNSGLFDFKRDRLSASLQVDNKVLKSIISQLYYPVSPYEFSVLPVEILGSAYEQFLGKQIKLNARHKAEVHDKPEVRKAGGVYYTPQYIVDYIVAQTVGKLVEGKKPEAVAKLKIVDPACGSGSFLIGAYSFLLQWHLAHYTPAFKRLSEIAASTDYNSKQRNDAVKERSRLPLTPDGALTTALKKQILLNNIYGVDIDVQAVEVTKLSLLLKCMEGETSSSITAEMRFGERVLPTLDGNIKSGNSLIDLDFYDGEIDYEPGAEKTIKPFRWEKAFPQVFKSGGFDVVIGNPPYIRIQSILETSPQQADYFSRKYQSSSKGNYDIYVIFIEKALELINKSGKVGFILPHKFFNAHYGLATRNLLLTKKAISGIVHFGDQQIFDGASTYTCILLLGQEQKALFGFQKVTNLSEWRNSEKEITELIRFEDLQNEEWNFISGNTQQLFNRLKDLPCKLEGVTERIFQGLKTSADKIFIVRRIGETKNYYSIYCSQNEKHYQVEKTLFHSLIKGGDSLGYVFDRSERLIFFPYKNSTLIPEGELKEFFPLTYAYIKEHKSYLENRENGKMKTAKWYGYVYPKALDVISAPKIFTPDISPNASYAIDQTGETFFTGGVSGGYGIIAKDGVLDLYLLGLLNSKLLDWYLKQISTQMRGGWYSFEAKFIRHLPIVTQDENNKQICEALVKQAQMMLSLKKEKSATTLPQQLESLEQRIAYTDEKINRLVYELYGLTEEEIKIVEGNGAAA